MKSAKSATTIDGDGLLFIPCPVIAPTFLDRIEFAYDDPMAFATHSTKPDGGPLSRLVHRFGFPQQKTPPRGGGALSGVTTGRRDMYLYICGSVGGRSGSLVPFGAKLWEAVTLFRRR